MGDQKTLVLLVLAGLVAALAAVYLLGRRFETGPRTRIYKGALVAVMALVVGALTAPIWLLGLKMIFRNQ